MDWIFLLCNSGVCVDAWHRLSKYINNELWQLDIDQWPDHCSFPSIGGNRNSPWLWYSKILFYPCRMKAGLWGNLHTFTILKRQISSVEWSYWFPSQFEQSKNLQISIKHRLTSIHPLSCSFLSRITPLLLMGFGSILTFNPMNKHIISSGRSSCFASFLIVTSFPTAQLPPKGCFMFRGGYCLLSVQSH